MKRIFGLILVFALNACSPKYSQKVVSGSKHAEDNRFPAQDEVEAMVYKAMKEGEEFRKKVHPLNDSREYSRLMFLYNNEIIKECEEISERNDGVIDFKRILSVTKETAEKYAHVAREIRSDSISSDGEIEKARDKILCMFLECLDTNIDPFSNISDQPTRENIEKFAKNNVLVETRDVKGILSPSGAFYEGDPLGLLSYASYSFMQKMGAEECSGIFSMDFPVKGRKYNTCECSMN